MSINKERAEKLLNYINELEIFISNINKSASQYKHFVNSNRAKIYSLCRESETLKAY